MDKSYFFTLFISFAVNALQQKMQGTQSVLSCGFQSHSLFCAMKKHVKHPIFQHETPVFHVIFYRSAFQFRKKFTVSCRNFKTQNYIYLRRKVSKFEKKIRLTLEIPVRKALQNRKTLKNKDLPTRNTI